MNTIKLFLVVCISVVCFSAGNTQSVNEQAKSKNVKETNFYKIQEDFNKKWGSRSPVKGQGYNVYKRWEAMMEPRVFPSGDITLPSSNYENYITWQKENAQVTTRSAPNNWTTLGPSTKPTGYDGGVGRVDFVRFLPGNPTTMFVGTPDGGLWKSTTGGNSWASLSDDLPILGCSDLVIHPTNTQIMYIATGNWESDRRSAGVFKTVDGGANWSPTSLSWTPDNNYKIRRMIMDPTDPTIMMVATDGGVFRTTDGWATWDNSGLNGNHYLYDIKFKPGDHLTVYASGTGGAGGAGLGVFWKSVDNGENWTTVTSGLPASADVSRIIIGTSIADPTVVYLLAGNSSSGYLGLYKSSDSGTGFSTQSTSPNILHSSSNAMGSGGQATHDLAIAVAPDNANKVTIGGINQWRSTDGGVNWSLFTYWLGIDPIYPGEGSLVPYTHADIQDIQYLPGSLPGSMATLFVTADGGIYKTTDDGANFSDISDNLNIAQQTNVAQSASTAGIIVTGLQDIGTIKKAGVSYSVINGGDGESAFIDRTLDDIIVTSNPNGAHDISWNGGLDKTSMMNIPAGTEFYSPISQDPVNGDIMYAGGRSALYKNLKFWDTPHTWTTAGTPLGAGSVLEYVVAPSNNQIIYAIKSNMISKTVNGGGAWTNVTGSLPVGAARATQITVSNMNPDKAWITFSGYSAGNKVWKTIDGGATWSNMSTGLPNLPVNTVVFVKNSAKDEVYIGMDIGVWQYENATANRGPGTWSTFNSGLPNAKVTDLEIFYPTSGAPLLRASTYGRGTWESEIQATVVPVELVSFTGEALEKDNLLEWHTAVEINLEEFQIERSSDGENYATIGKVLPDDSESANEYQFIDRNRVEGINFYRLKIVDLDGTVDYSKTIVLYTKGRDTGMKLFPNPAITYVQLTGLTKDDMNMTLRDQLGRIITKSKVNNATHIRVNYLPNGTYYIEISDELGSQGSTMKFIKI